MTKLEKMIWDSAPGAFLVTKSKTIVLPGFQNLPLYDVIVFFTKQVQKVGLNERAAAISFNLVMALPAAILFLFSLIPFFPNAQNMQKEILNVFRDISPNTNTYQLIRNLITDLLNTGHAGVFSFGFLALIFYASNAMMGVIRSFDKSIHEPKRRYFFQKRVRAIRLTFLLIVLVMISTFALLVGGEQLVFVLKKIFNMKRAERIPWWNGLRWTIILGLLYFGIALIYKYAPSIRKRWKLRSPGAILATALTLATIALFSYWVNNFGSYNKVYGSIGTVLIIMVLIYINSLILLIGFELNVSIVYLTREAEARMQRDEAKLEEKALGEESHRPKANNQK
ncbi:YihY/virulence factor BrkB family protein [Sediminibacterium soli]|uniref:YihY/virulence factor BrkB family protein n=1 Tax=Sediminibacterium soli TaxID=2698829 RepID=UPI00137B1BD4|nr:YihY/virulence factor BrkB family protein [Sediminibacterium soli]NCI46016.1 YihY/virulence factor BrkB family protein [Sediminibacterium soli]